MFKAHKIIKHPSFSPSKVDQGNDIALIYLDRDVEWSYFVKPICLAADKHLSFAGAIATVAGWRLTEGDDEDELVSSPVLKSVDVPIFYNKQCKQWIKEEQDEEFLFPSGVMCAGLKDGGRDTYRADSGGPLMVKHCSGRYVQAGITSWGIECAKPKLPGVYTRLNHNNFLKIIKYSSVIISDT